MLGINTYMHLVLIANSDPLIVAVCLAAIDCHLSRRYRLAFGMLVLASLGRPEAWVFAGLYGRGRSSRSRRCRCGVMAVAGLVLIPVFWFSVPALTSHSWFISGDLALNQQTVIHGNKIVGVVNRFRSLYELPMQLAMLLGVVLAVLRRDRTTLLVVGRRRDVAAHRDRLRLPRLVGGEPLHDRARRGDGRRRRRGHRLAAGRHPHLARAALAGTGGRRWR